jgi:hypothetical protein
MIITSDIIAVIQELNSVFDVKDIQSYLPFAFNVGNGNNDADLYGKLVKDYDNVDLHYLTLYTNDNEVGYRYPGDTFEKLVLLGSKLPGVSKIQLVFVGPNSSVPWHTDGMHLTEEERIELDAYNIIIPAFVPPSAGLDIAGIQIEEEFYTADHLFALENNRPHWAWNRSNEWWVMLICYTKGKYINENFNT